MNTRKGAMMLMKKGAEMRRGRVRKLRTREAAREVKTRVER